MCCVAKMRFIVSRGLSERYHSRPSTSARMEKLKIAFPVRTFQTLMVLSLLEVARRSSEVGWNRSPVMVYVCPTSTSYRFLSFV